MNILQDILRCRFKDADQSLTNESGSTQYRLEYLMIILKTVIMNIAEQEWVTYRMYQVAESNNMDAFNHDRLKQNCLGQQLLRLGIRRGSEKDIMNQLTVCNSNSKRALIDKLLSVMNFWNMRATIFDIKLMIKEISPEVTQKHQQQGAIAADALMTEFAKCVRDLFTTALKSNQTLPDAVNEEEFRLVHITNFWLMPIFMKLCPEPKNVPTAFQPMTVSGKFLKEASTMLEIERNPLSCWYLQQSPFINLVLICIDKEKGSYGKDNRDVLILSLHRQINDIVAKRRELSVTNVALPNYAKYKEGLILRIALVGRIFQQVCTPQHAESWAILLAQILMTGVVSKENERRLYDVVYDMLGTLIMWSLLDPNSQQTTVTENNESRHRWPYFSGIMKKLKKELSDRRNVGNFMDFDVAAVEPHGTKVNPLNMKTIGPPSSKAYLQVSESVKLNAYDFITGFIPDQSQRGGWRWSMFQPQRYERTPFPIQKNIIKIVGHKHPTESKRPIVIPMDLDEVSDMFLTPPDVDKTIDTPITSPSSTPKKEDEETPAEETPTTEVCSSTTSTTSTTTTTVTTTATTTTTATVILEN